MNNILKFLLLLTIISFYWLVFITAMECEDDGRNICGWRCDPKKNVTDECGLNATCTKREDKKDVFLCLCGEFYKWTDTFRCIKMDKCFTHKECHRASYFCDFREKCQYFNHNCQLYGKKDWGVFVLFLFWFLSKGVIFVVLAVIQVKSVGKTQRVAKMVDVSVVLIINGRT